jgi:alkylation response protein AidB-like acyl-CoA dehydrogenase
MDLTLNQEELALRDEVRGWLEENHPGPLPPGEDEGFEFRRRWQKRLHERGWAGVSWPAEYGGAGASLSEQVIINEELVRAGTPPMANLLGLSMAGPTLITHGTDEQKRRYLPGILSADEIWCQGFSEPDAGSDLASLKTRAVRDGDGWVVTGQKVWTSLAQYSRWCVLVARTDPDAPKHKGLSYFVLDMEQEGVEVRPLIQITGEAEFNELWLHEARIEPDQLVGAEGEGWKIALTTLAHERSTNALALQVELAVVLNELIEYAGEVGPNGAPAAADPGIRDRIAQLWIESEVLRLTALRGLAEAELSGDPGPEGTLGKWHWSQINQAATELALDIAGPLAQLEQDPWTHRFLRARANSIEGGATEVLKNIVAERVLGLPRLR